MLLPLKGIVKMAKVKSFLNVPVLVSNISGQVSPVGELSPRSLTFSRDVGLYSNPLFPDVSLTTFQSLNTAGDKQVTPDAVNVSQLTVGNFIIDSIINGAGFGTPSDLALALDTTLGAVGDTFSSGPFVIIGALEFPEWVSWQYTHNTSVYEIKLWFADAAFRSQNKDFTIIVLPPVSNVDLLFGTYSAVYNLMQTRTTATLLNDAAIASGPYPYTHFVTRNYNWVNPNNPTQTVSTPWGFLIYGDAGNNEDNIRNAAVDFILEDSIRLREEWKTVLPSLFINTEHIITPLWDRLATTNQNPSSSLYSATFRPNDLANYALQTSIGYTEAHVRLVVEGSFFTYKSLAFAVIGGSENVDGIVTFHERFPDYMPINPQSADFSRMSPATQEWANRLNEMLPVAETLNDNSSLQPYMSVTVRGGVTFLGSRINDVLYLVAAKSNFT